MRPLSVISACFLACSLFTGCTHISNSSSKYFNSLLVYAHIRNAPAEPEAPQVCVLDPLAAAGQLAEQPSAASDKSPAVVVPETTWDFGKIIKEEELTHGFNIKNVGNSVLTIKKVLPG